MACAAYKWSTSTDVLIGLHLCGDDRGCNRSYQGVGRGGGRGRTASGSGDAVSAEG